MWHILWKENDYDLCKHHFHPLFILRSSITENNTRIRDCFIQKYYERKFFPAYVRRDISPLRYRRCNWYWSRGLSEQNDNRSTLCYLLSYSTYGTCNIWEIDCSHAYLARNSQPLDKESRPLFLLTLFAVERASRHFRTSCSARKNEESSSSIRSTGHREHYFLKACPYVVTRLFVA